MRWYDVLVHLEESPEGIRMNELAERILYSKSGFTRVVDRMEEAGLVRRVRPEHDRRSILVVLTDKGTETMEHARRYHRDGIERHFSQHLTDADIKRSHPRARKGQRARTPASPGTYPKLETRLERLHASAARASPARPLRFTRACPSRCRSRRA